jgi:hypothetical protein
LPSDDPVGVSCIGSPMTTVTLGADTMTLTARHDIGNGYQPVIVFATDVTLGPGFEGDFHGHCQWAIAPSTPNVMIYLDRGDLTLGAHPLDNVTLQLTVSVVTKDGVFHWAVSGGVTLDGYDPLVGSVCGSVDVVLDNGQHLHADFAAAHMNTTPMNESCPDMHS